MAEIAGIDDVKRSGDGPRLPIKLETIDGSPYISGVVSLPWRDHPAPIDSKKVSFDRFIASGFVSLEGGRQVIDAVAVPLTISVHKEGDTLPDGTIAGCSCFWIRCKLVLDLLNSKMIHAAPQKFYFAFSSGMGKDNDVVVDGVGIYRLPDAA